LTNPDINDLPVLFLRINSREEIVGSDDLLNQLPSLFPNSPVLTLSTPQTLLTPLLEQDPRFAKVLLYPPKDSLDLPKTARGLARFLSSYKFRATVIAIHSCPSLDYAKHIVASILAPKPQFFLDSQHGLTPLLSVRGLAIFLSSLVSFFTKTLTNRLLARRARSIPAVAAGVSPKRLLWIRLDLIGDCVMSLPALCAIKASHPDCVIDVLTQPLNLPLLSEVPEVNEVIVYRSPVHYKGADWPASKSELNKLKSELRSRKYDIAIDSRGDDEGRQLAFLSGAKLRIGHLNYSSDHSDLNTLFLTHPYRLQAPGHAVDNAMSLVQSAGLASSPPSWNWEIGDDIKLGVYQKLSEMGLGDTFAVVHMVPSSERKSWSRDGFADVIDHLTSSHNLSVLLSGASADREVNQSVLERTLHPALVKNGAGVLSLGEMLVVLEMSRILVTVDTGPMHIASSVGAPVVAILLQENVGQFSPYGQAERVLSSVGNANDLAHPLLAISSQQVIDLVDRVLDETKSSERKGPT